MLGLRRFCTIGGDECHTVDKMAVMDYPLFRGEISTHMIQDISQPSAYMHDKPASCSEFHWHLFGAFKDTHVC